MVLGQGVLVTLAIGLHNIPEGLAVATVLVARGVSPRQALWWSLFTSLPQPLLAVPSFMFVEAFQVTPLIHQASIVLHTTFAHHLPSYSVSFLLA